MKSLVFPVALGLVVASNAVGQSPEMPSSPPPEASQFDYLIGDWDFEATYTFPDGQAQRWGTWHAAKAFDDFGLIDEWRLVDETGSPLALITTVRIFDAQLGKWSLRSLDVYSARWTEQYAEHHDGEMHLEWSGRDRFGQYMMRVRYYDIERDRFSWIADRSYDGGETWMKGWLRIEANRRR